MDNEDLYLDELVERIAADPQLAHIPERLRYAAVQHVVFERVNPDMQRFMQELLDAPDSLWTDAIRLVRARTSTTG